MGKVQSRWLISLVLLTLMSALLPAPAAAQQGPTGVQSYIRPGERVVTIQPGLRYKGRVYEVQYFTTGSYNRKEANLFYQASPAFFKNQQITALLVTADGNLVDDEALLRDVFTLYRAAYYLYERPPSGALGLVDDSFVDDLRKVTRNPLFLEQQIKAIFSTRWEETAEALRGILTPQVSSPDDLTAFGNEVRRSAETGKTAVEAVDRTLEAARFSNDRTVRGVAREIREVFKSWRPVTQQGTSYVDLSGTRIELFNALDVLSLSVRLIWLADLQRERADWLTTYVTFSAGDAAFDQDQALASATVVAEANENWVQRANIILQFAKDNAADLGIRLAAEALAQQWVKWSWQTFGKRTTGHLVAGAASAVLLGFTIGNLLYGLDDLFNNFKAGERADEVRHRFRDGRLQLQQKVVKRAGEPYDGSLAAQFRIAYMLESLAAAQMYRSYANGVEATVRQGLLALINPINWFRGKEWREAVKTIREVADSIEQNAEGEIGHPLFVDTAVELVKARLRQPTSLLSAAPTSPLFFDVVLPGEMAHLRIEVRNTGQNAWQPAQGIELRRVRKDAAVAERYPLPRAVSPGETATWDITFDAGGVRFTTLRFQMHEGDRPFGPEIGALVITIPEQLKAQEEKIRQAIEQQLREWQQQAEQELERRLEELQRQLLELIQREVERQAQNLIDQLCGASALLPMGALALWWARRRK